MTDNRSELEKKLDQLPTKTDFFFAGLVLFLSPPVALLIAVVIGIWP